MCASGRFEYVEDEDGKDWKTPGEGQKRCSHLSQYGVTSDKALKPCLKKWTACIMLNSILGKNLDELHKYHCSCYLKGNPQIRKHIE